MLWKSPAALAWASAANATLKMSHSMKTENMRLTLLPLHVFSTLTFYRFHFSNTVKITQFQALSFKSCMYTSKNSDFHIDSHAPLLFKDFQKFKGTINADNNNLKITRSKFVFENEDSIKIKDSPYSEFESTYFSSKSSNTLVSMKGVKSALIKSCNFSKISSGTLDIDQTYLVVRSTLFDQSNAKRGAAIKLSNSNLIVEYVDTVSCESTIEGGAFYLDSGSAVFRYVSFTKNIAPIGNSIFSSFHFDMNFVYFTGISKEEVAGKYYGSNVFFDIKKPKRFADKNTPSPSASIPPTPLPTTTPGPTAISYLNPALFTSIVIVAVAFVLVILIIAIGYMVYLKTKKQRNTIYAIDDDAKDENGMGTAEIKSMYSLSKMYQ